MYKNRTLVNNIWYTNFKLGT